MQDTDLDYLGDEYLIGWRSNVTGVSGRGTEAMPYSVAVAMCKNLDAFHPELQHYPLTRQVLKYGQVVERD
jgi:hypothetical protein